MLEGLSKKAKFFSPHTHAAQTASTFRENTAGGESRLNYYLDLALRSGVARNHCNALDITCSTVVPCRFAMTRSSLIVCGLSASAGSAPHVNLITVCFFIGRTC